jgi:hypothetical protein
MFHGFAPKNTLRCSQNEIGELENIDEPNTPRGSAPMIFVEQDTTSHPTRVGDPKHITENVEINDITVLRTSINNAKQYLQMFRGFAA